MNAPTTNKSKTTADDIRAYQYLDLSVLPVPPDEAGVAAAVARFVATL